MRRVCQIILIGFAVLYGLALGLFVIGTYGLFGSPSGPLAGIYLVPLGLPWTQMISAFPERLWPWLGILAPALNLLIVLLICRWMASREASKES